MRILVTGGAGFLGRAIVRELGDRFAVRTFSRSAASGDHVRGDIADRNAVLAAADGCDAIVHTAAKAGVWGEPTEYHAANVLGTENVLHACRAHGIEWLVHTSTPSVVHTGGDIEGGDERLPYAERPTSAYQATKIEAERAVLAANARSLRTIALRPHLIWGPGDPHLVPRILERGRRGRIALPGGGTHRVDTVYVDNAARAHVCALDRLIEGAPDAAGRAYFISNGEPRPLASIVQDVLRCGGIARPRIIPIPRTLAHGAGALLEHAFTKLAIDREPPLTRFVAEQLATAHWFDISAAKRDLRWAPHVSLDRGFALLRESLS